ncbi:MAG: MetQ/NlpA family ABC transporter substrate-binding protein [Lachnospiraceae bacterium]|nr:MetQ/NlpA family ABC transporter substrate-binding protein [Lachnospiraceae bacterium]
MKKGLALLLAAVLCVAAFTGCGNSNAETKAADETVKLTVAASPTPHAEILNEAKALLADKGIELEVIEFTDYVQPNLVVDEGDIDANYFQHTPYLDSFNEEQGTALVSAGSIHYEPLGIYPGKSNDLANIPEGATIVVPNDTTNEARALMLLEVNGIITLKEGAGLKATKMDIVENPYNVEIVEMEAAQVAKQAPDVDFVVVNGNYALLAEFSIEDALAIEEADSEAAKTYANIIAVREGDETRADIQTLIEVLKSDEIKSYIEATYAGAVLPTE